MMKPVRFTHDAERDFDHAVMYHLGVGGEPLAIRFVEEIDHAVERIRNHPESGSPRPGFNWDLPGLRATFMPRFRSWIIYYRNTDQEIILLRILDGRQNLRPKLFPKLDD
jgi:toxin ParE1/3/4